VKGSTADTRLRQHAPHWSEEQAERALLAAEGQSATAADNSIREHAT